ncbi:VWFA domain-containing protein [Caenorhabditis elegans]|uniref:VWFA domain-containing protein n=1 Tax=Caenorhabditis elegans TaxID=6239 RepID=Q22783_CAEEL|nr:VWFA domain-containing protein [Caenorhabditis elegans]CCD74457.1 VWFA domain-containing protein [Caenorhabditis elegans]|eukprot:NP_510791.3 Uncharacterized protein CELE_T25G12.6 [Caenorhabditis elegans]
MARGDGDDASYVSPGVPHRNVKWYLLEDTDNRVKWFTILLLLISIGMLIAGSVMLGIGISKNNSAHPAPTPPVSTQASGYTMFLSVQTRSVPYSAVVRNYAGSVKNLTDQMQQVISSSSSASSDDVQPTVPITILGISNAGQWADVMYALSYTTSNKPQLNDIQQKVSASPNFAMISATDQTPPTLSQMTCRSVSDSTLITTSGPSGTTVTVPTTPCASVPTGPTKTPVTVPTSTGSVSRETKSPVTANPGSTVSTSLSSKPVTVVTQSPRSTTTPFVKTPYSKDVIILLDNSNAMKSFTNFNLVKSWIVKTLLPLWLIDREDVQVAFATYAANDFNTLLDFDEASEEEVASVISAQMYSGKHNSSITYGIRAAGDIHGLRPVNQSVILLSASEDLTDIESATQYAYILSALPKQLITITLNSSGKQLGLLSTNQNMFFGVPDYNLTTTIAQQLTQYMFVTLTPTTQTPTTTSVPDNTCNTDVTILMDNNNDVGSAMEFQNQCRTIAKLIKTWPISPKLMEGEAIVYSTTDGGQIVENPFSYQSASAFANEVMAFDDYYFAASPPSLTASLQYVSQNLGRRRQSRQQATIVFTYSSSYSDVQTAIEYVTQIGGNLIIVAVGGADQTVLKQLTGNVVYTKTLTTDIFDQINSLLCTPSTKSPPITPTTIVSTSGATSSAAQTTVAVTTTQIMPSTTSMPNPCHDCSPKTSNILLLFEAYGTALSNQKKLAETDLIATWNHFERTSVMGFNTLVKNLDPINFGDLQTKDEFVSIVDSFTPFKDQPSIVSAFNMAVNRANPLKSFGKMNSVIFTSGATPAEITASLMNSQTLRQNGKVIIVGLQLPDATHLDTLCDVLLKWDDLTNTETISTQINQALSR